MKTRATSFLLICVLVLAPMAFCQTPTPTPGANTTLKSPDVLFEQAIQAARNAHYAEARTLLEKLIRSYPNSDYVARAKLSIGDTWYAEGVWQRALVEYQDFITFFPNRPEVTEARQKIDAIQKKAE
ncbi:MAG TPA: outer membrane protein assembly factor BamD [Candidatus Angelobacter sp.]|nr:outer membrane protein assembly factor BamD [Candidatus Angelobacter sp.]